METILVILMPVRSHFNAVIGLADALKKDGAKPCLYRGNR